MSWSASWVTRPHLPLGPGLCTAAPTPPVQAQGLLMRRAGRHDQMQKRLQPYPKGPPSRLSNAAHAALPEALPLAPQTHTVLSLSPLHPGLWLSWAAPTPVCVQPHDSRPLAL
ncbi:hypothetical protein VULLAG_LOCUS17863 [Vulpes lagopus]